MDTCKVHEEHLSGQVLHSPPIRFLGDIQKPGYGIILERIGWISRIKHQVKRPLTGLSCQSSPYCLSCSIRSMIKGSKCFIPRLISSGTFLRKRTMKLWGVTILAASHQGVGGLTVWARLEINWERRLTLQRQGCTVHSMTCNHGLWYLRYLRVDDRLVLT